MPERRFVHRRDSIPDQGSPISTQEQARLLNDPEVPIQTEHSATERNHAEKNANHAAIRPTPRTPEHFVETEKAV
jgi:hypothetical protein